VAERYLEVMQKDELLVGDRLYGYADFLKGIARKESYFIIRHHAAMVPKPTTELSPGERSETGMVFEQQVQVGEKTYRMIVVQLDQLTREKESEIRILSNLSKEHASAVPIAQIDRLRWTLEGTFKELTQSVRCELKSLGYPRAALLTFALAVCAVNTLRVVTRALEESQGQEYPEEEVSSYYVVNELVLVNEGMDVVVPQQAWEGFHVASASEMAEWLLEVAKRADWKKYRKSKRGPKKEVEKIKATKQTTHRSTFRLLEAKKGLPKSPPRP
jgi:hypothetical protein